MNSVVYALVYALAVTVAVTKAGNGGPECPTGCPTEVEDGKTMCNCCRERKDEEIPLLDPCAGVRCAGVSCQSNICPTPETCGNNLIAQCKNDPCEGQPYGCPDGELMAYTTANCKFCFKPDSNFTNPCADDKECKEPIHECTLQQVTCIAAPCNLTKRCRKVCPLVNCLTGCRGYIDRDGCQKCRCCKYQLK